MEEPTAAPATQPTGPAAGRRRYAVLIGVGSILLGLAAIPLLARFLADRFFRLEGVVTTCATRMPIAGAAVVVSLDEAGPFRPGSGPRVAHTKTNEQGRFDALLDVPSEAWAYVTIAHDGYTSTRTHLRAMSEQQLQACLVPSE